MTTRKFDPVYYAFGVIWLNAKRFGDSDWEYLGGHYQFSQPHGIDNKYWQFAMEAFLAMADD